MNNENEDSNWRKVSAEVIHKGETQFSDETNEHDKHAYFITFQKIENASNEYSGHKPG